jgi:hypothetical protein
VQVAPEIGVVTEPVVAYTSTFGSTSVPFGMYTVPLMVVWAKPRLLQAAKSKSRLTIERGKFRLLATKLPRGAIERFDVVMRQIFLSLRQSRSLCPSAAHAGQRELPEPRPLDQERLRNVDEMFEWAAAKIRAV